MGQPKEELMSTIGKNIGILSRQLTLFLNRELADSDVTATELMYLGTLYVQDGITQDDLAKEYCIDKAATTRTIQGMEKKGIVVRKADPADKRAKRVYLTTTAYSYQSRIEEVQRKWMAIADIGMSEEESAVFEKQISDMAERIKTAVRSEEVKNDG
jgi:DNA-binding MarR family transcriptional regulator